MEFCTFHKGKRKMLQAETLPGRDSGIFVIDYNDRCRKLMQQIDTELNKLYENVVYDVGIFAKSMWEDSTRPPGMPVAVVRSDAMDGYDFEYALNDLMKIQPIRITPSQTVSLYDLHQMLIDRGPYKYVMLRQIECFAPGPYLDGLISVLTDPIWDGKVVLVVTLAVDFNIIFTRFSQENLWRLAIFCFHLPTPSTALQAVCEAIAIRPESYMLIDGALLKALRDRFLRDNLSISEMKRTLKITLLHQLLENEDFGCGAVATRSKNAELEMILGSYDSFLYLLHDLTDGFPIRAEDAYELHSWIQTNPNFFFEKDGIYAKWKSYWLTWSVETIVESLLKLWNPVRKMAACYSNEMQKLIVDLREVDQRKASMQKEAQPEHNNTGKKRVSLQEMQQRMREKMAHKKRQDIVYQDRQRFIKLLTQIMSRVLRNYNKVQSLEGKLLVGKPELIRLVVPTKAAAMETALLKPSVTAYESSGTQMDICTAYRALLDLSMEKNGVTIFSWLQRFKRCIKEMKGVDTSIRLFRCIGELEYLGIVKAANARNKDKVTLTYVPYTFSF